MSSLWIFMCVITMSILSVSVFLRLTSKILLILNNKVLLLVNWATFIFAKLLLLLIDISLNRCWQPVEIGIVCN